MISKTGEAETITTHYLFFLGLYRALYLANWIRRYQTENFYDQIAVVSGVVQTIFYCDFFYLYVTKGRCCENSVAGTVSVTNPFNVWGDMEEKRGKPVCPSWCLHSNMGRQMFSGNSAMKKYRPVGYFRYYAVYREDSYEVTFDKILGLGKYRTNTFQREQLTCKPQGRNQLGMIKDKKASTVNCKLRYGRSTKMNHLGPQLGQGKAFPLHSNHRQQQLGSSENQSTSRCVGWKAAKAGRCSGAAGIGQEVVISGKRRGHFSRVELIGTVSALGVRCEINWGQLLDSWPAKREWWHQCPRWGQWTCS